MKASRWRAVDKAIDDQMINERQKSIKEEQQPVERKIKQEHTTNKRAEFKGTVHTVNFEWIMGD